MEKIHRERCLETLKPCVFKVAPSFWFLNVNTPIFDETVFKLSQEDVVKNFLAVHRQNVDQIASLVLYVLL